MENGARGGGGVNGFSVSDKEVAASGGGGAGNGNVVVVGSYGLGEVMHTNSIMMGRHIHHGDGFDGGDGGSGGDAGPTSGANKNNIYTYGDDVATAPQTSSGIPLFTVGGGGGGGGAVAVRLSQPFNCSNSSPLPFKSPGVATALGFPFTCAQWKELERQAMVYKYMMASVPVPPDLLLPIPTNNYTAAPNFHTQSGGSSGCVLGFPGKNKDLEPGRCKRTDGKKWRCSKEVAPNQKYCERHLHRGRPRSRKPVEDHTTNNSKKTRLQQPSPLESASMVISQPAINSAPSSSDKHNEGPQSLDTRMDHSFSISPFSEPHRSLDWEMVAMGGSEEQWQQLMAFESSVYRDNNAQIFQQMNLFHCKDYYGSVRQNGECNLYLNPDLGSLDKEFVNAWANGNIANNSNTNTDTGSCASPSALSLSVAMAAGNILDSEMGVLESHVANCDDEHNMCSNLTLRSPVSWVPFASGGPLAEVLKPSQHHNHPSSSSYISNGDSISPAGTTVSSPSGVLQKTTLFSQSDGSVCNSPTLAAAELVPFQWLS